MKGEKEEKEEESESDGEHEAGRVEELPQMLNPALRSALTKQGYRLLGSHSGVKLCRWTKSMLRGRGGCYKHTFYGISSFQCMEMTPSLACANKCVFCWRHHSNPVGTRWKWQVDAPEFLLAAAMENHAQLVKQMRGVPGVTADRMREATTIRHCALSLVGEPIIYPHINQFVGMLHARDISTFMVTNAQFPEKVRDLAPVTQFYLSVDAATPETLKAVDRPLFKDFWERMIGSIDALHGRTDRTVFRLTLVKQYNMEEVESYAQLAVRGLPDFIEVKGVTYCGVSDASPLTIRHTPFHVEVVSFCRALEAALARLVPASAEAEYGLACEHEHSLCVLIANKRKFNVDGRWRTWIDYSRFFELVRSGKPFRAIDYMAETPSWAVFGAEEKGFDPDHERFRRTKKGAPTAGC